MSDSTKFGVPIPYLENSNLFVAGEDPEDVNGFFHVVRRDTLHMRWYDYLCYWGWGNIDLMLHVTKKLLVTMVGVGVSLGLLNYGCSTWIAKKLCYLLII